MSTMVSGGSDTLPVVDVAPLWDGGAEGLAAVSAEIGRACRTTGFFYVSGHGIPDGLLADVFAASRSFFALPPADKARVSLAAAGNNRGYVGMDGENLDPDAPADMKEAFNIGREIEPGELVDPAAPSSGGTPWPDLAGFRPTMTAYYQACRRLCEELHAAFATDLGLASNYFTPFIDRPAATLRLLRYPPVGQVAAGLGAGTHSDYGNVTILAQDDVGGLEVRTRAGDWLQARPVPGALLCNIGDCLMRWSNDIYVSTPHRVLSPAAQHRYSLAFFFDPNLDAVIECLPGCRREDSIAKYLPILFEDYLRAKLDATYVPAHP